jgi:hypothetical protein
MRLFGYNLQPGKCHECNMGKETRKPFLTVTDRSDIKLFRVYSDNKIRSKLRDVTFIEDEFLPRTAFLRIPYADRPLQVPEPRNYSEEDQEPDDDELAELFPPIDPNAPVPVIPRLPYLPVPQTQNVLDANTRLQFRLSLIVHSCAHDRPRRIR